jgi:fatty-acyl-CoA synthase
MTTVADLLRGHASNDGPALLFEEQVWTYRELVAEGMRRGQFLLDNLDPERPPHVGVLLDNVPEYIFWLAGAALTGSIIVGINSTYRGSQLAQLVEFTDCQMIMTSNDKRSLLDGLEVGVGEDRIFEVDVPAYAAMLPSQPAGLTKVVNDNDLFLLIFTSGSTGLPKAVRCTHGRFTTTGSHVAQVTKLGAGDVVYAPLPFFHSSSLFTGWSSSLQAGTPIAIRTRFSASGTLSDIRRYGATVMTYTGKVLNYILAVPDGPHDGDTTLRLAIGNEASARDLTEFARRFHSDVRDSYGSTEGIIIIRRDPSMPPTALGQAAESVKVLNADTGLECPAAKFDEAGRVLNLDEAVGEIVETSPTTNFEGYYKNEDATQARFRDGCYWSGDLAYRDSAGWFYFAGRSNEWLRVDGENFAAAPVEAIISRFSAVRSVAVYAVPDDPVGDRVMVAVEAEAGSQITPEEFDRFLSEQPDLGTKWKPQFARIVDELPKLASMKIDKQRLRREAWRAGGVWWRPKRGGPLEPMGHADMQALEHLLA